MHRTDLPTALAERGLATIDDVHTHEDLLQLAKQLVSIRPHRSAGPDGVSVITDRGDTRSGYAAYSTAGLPPHTDGTSMPTPPRLIFLACQAQAGEGGESQLIDGRAVYRTLAGHHPAELAALSKLGSAVFNGRPASVFERVGGRIMVRCRFDDLVEYSPAASAAVPALKAAIAEHTDSVHLAPGQGYVIDNSRWIHGRAAFAGERVMLRVLGDLRPRAALPVGFAP